MDNCSIEFNKDLVIVSGPGGFSIADPYQGFIEFLYMDKKGLDTILDLETDKARILYDNASDFSFFPILLWGIYNIEDAECLTHDLKTKMLKDLKKSQGYFYEQARIFLDENPLIEDYAALTPKERYCKLNTVNGSVRCQLLLDEDTMETIERYYPESLFEACYIFFIKMVLKNSTIKRCGYCGKYFEKRPGYNNEYCPRRIPGKNKTCKDVGAIARYKQSKDDIQKMFDKHYKKVSAYCKRHKLKAPLASWLENASELRVQARSTNMTVNEFDSKLNKIETEVIYNGKEGR